MSNLHVIDHPLITHKLSIMRNRKTGSKDFRELLNEIAMLMGYEVFRDLPLEEITIETPITKMKAKMVSGRKLAIVPILARDWVWWTVCRTWFRSPRWDTSACTATRRRISR